MNPGRSRLVPMKWGPIFIGAILLLGGCLGPPDLDAGSDPLVVTEASRGLPVEQSPTRAAVVSEMRAKAEAGDAMPAPDVFQSAQTARLAARPEPKPIGDVASVEAELAAIAERERTAVTPGELAALKARADELRRIAAAVRAGSLR